MLLFSGLVVVTHKSRVANILLVIINSKEAKFLLFYVLEKVLKPLKIFRQGIIIG